MSNKEVEQILDKLLGRVTKLDEKIEDLKQVVIWREQGVLRSGQEMREKIDSMDAHRAQELKGEGPGGKNGKPWPIHKAD